MVSSVVHMLKCVGLPVLSPHLSDGNIEVILVSPIFKTPTDLYLLTKVNTTVPACEFLLTHLFPNTGGRSHIDTVPNSVITCLSPR